MLPVYKEKIALWDWYEIESTGSTNDEIKRLVPSSGSSVALSAIRQTGGAGAARPRLAGNRGEPLFNFQPGHSGCGAEPLCLSHRLKSG